MIQQTKTCDGCGGEYAWKSGYCSREWAKRRFCTKRCMLEVWPVKRVIAGEFVVQHTGGYIKVFVPMHPASNSGYVYLHRLIAERKIGRLLIRGEVVHHINEDVTDNRPENLQVLTHKQHRQIHAGVVMDPELAEMIVKGVKWDNLLALGVSTRRLVRVRRELRQAGAIT